MPPARAEHVALVSLVEVRTGHGVWQPGDHALLSAEEGSPPLLASGAFTSETEVLGRCLCVWCLFFNSQTIKRNVWRRREGGG